MRDDSNDSLNGRNSSSGELLNELDSIKELLDKELKQERIAPATTVEEIGSVEEYLRLKQEADSAGVSIDAYLAQQSAVEEPDETLELIEDEEDSSPLLDEVVTLENHEEESKQDSDALLIELAEERQLSTSETTSVEEYFAAVVAAKHRQANQPNEPQARDDVAVPSSSADELNAEEQIPLLDETVGSGNEIPVLAEVATEDSLDSTEKGISLDEMQELVDLLVNRKLQQLKPELEKEVMSELQRMLPNSTLTNS